MSVFDLDTADALYVIVDHDSLADSDRELGGFVETVVQAGARLIQYRAKSLSAEDQFLNAVDIRDIIQDAGGRLIINGRADVAAAVGADGVHLPARGLPVAAARRMLKEGLIGRSTHDLDELKVADLDGADFATFSPVWSPLSKDDDRTTHGRDGLTEAVESLREWNSDVTLYALGGVTAERAEHCRQAGAGAASIGAVAHADDPASTIRTMLERLTH